MSDVFGEVISARDVERHVLDTLQHWMETYLQEREIKLGADRGFYVRPATYRVVSNFDDKNPEDAVPFIAVISDGLADEPVQNGEGGFRVSWRIIIGVVAEGATEEDAQDIVKDVYLPAIRMIMLQRQSLRDWTVPDAQPWSAGTRWVNESYDEFAPNSERTLFSGQLEYDVMVDEVVNRFAGPAVPADPVQQPGSDWPIAESGAVTLAVDES